MTGSVLANVYAGFSLDVPRGGRCAGAWRRNIWRVRSGAAGLPNAREALLIEQLRLWISGDTPAVQMDRRGVAARWPRDLASVKLDQYFCFNRGDAGGDAADCQGRSRRPIPDDPHLHGMLAFGYEQMHQLDLTETSRAARR